LEEIERLKIEEESEEIDTLPWEHLEKLKVELNQEKC